MLAGCGTINLPANLQDSIKEGLQEGLEQASSTPKESAPEKVQTITSDFSSISVDFPESWKTENLNDVATIQMARIAKEQYMIVIEEESVDFSDDFSVGDYADIIRTSMETVIETPEATEITDSVVGGVAAKQFELSGSVNKIKVTYFITCVENDGMFHQFTAWSLQSKYDEAKPVFESILESVVF